jgi:hypothetical protein
MYARRNAIHDICDHLSHWFHSPICTGGELEDAAASPDRWRLMPTHGARQGMMARSEMVGRGHVASVRGCDPSC